MAKRKRRARKDAIAADPQGGQGEVLDQRRPRQHMAMIRRAIREDWPIPPELRQKLVEKMGDALDGDDIKSQIAAAKVLVAADGVNVRREQIEMADEHKRLDKEHPDLHAHAVNHAEVRALRRDVIENDPAYIDYQRSTGFHSVTGDVRNGSEPGEMETGEASGDSGPGTS